MYIIPLKNTVREVMEGPLVQKLLGEAMDRIMFAAPGKPLTEAQFVLQIAIAYGTIYSGTTADCAIDRAKITYREFLDSEKIEFNDSRYDWSAQGAFDIMTEAEGVERIAAIVPVMGSNRAPTEQEGK